MAKVELSTARGKLHQDISEMLIFTNQRVSVSIRSVNLYTENTFLQHEK